MAYTTATILAGDLTLNSDGSVTAIVTFTGNAGELPVKSSYTVNSVAAAGTGYLRGQAMDKLAVLNSNKGVIDSLSLPLVLDTTTPLPSSSSVFGSYVAASAPFTPGATPQDVFGITGSANRLVTVTGIWIATVQTTAGNNAWLAVKRSTLNTGGTSAPVSAVPADSSHPAATALVRQYTANPSAGTLVGSIWSGRVPSPTPGTALSQPFAAVLSDRQRIVLNGAAEMLALNFNGQALPTGLSVQAIVAWQETA